jgi:copper homeostasis protein CutC
MNIPASLRRLAIQRANDRCEYCKIAQAGQVATFHIDHILPVVAKRVRAASVEQFEKFIASIASGLFVMLGEGVKHGRSRSLAQLPDPRSTTFAITA